MNKLFSFVYRTCCVCSFWHCLAQEPYPQPLGDQGSRQLLEQIVVPGGCAIQNSITSCCDTIATDFFTTGTLINHLEKTFDATTACDATPITASQTITMPGSYCLANDIDGNLWIEAPYVTLDLDGHTISGGANGIVIGCAAHDCTVRNGRITGAGYAGIIVRGCNCRISDLELIENYIGAFLSKLKATAVTNCRAIDSTWAGFSFMEVQTTKVTQCQAVHTSSTDRSFGFISQHGAENVFDACLAQNTQATLLDGSTYIAGFQLWDGEARSQIKTCIIDQTISSTQTGGNNKHKAYGIYLGQGNNDEGSTFAVSAQFNQGVNSTIQSLQWAQWANDSYLATGGSQGTDGNQVRIFFRNPDNSLSQVATFDHGANATINAVDWLTSNSLLAIGGQTGTGGSQLRVLNFQAPSTLTEITTADHGAPINAVDWLSSGTSRFLALGGQAGTDGYTVRVLEFSTTESTLTDRANILIDTTVNTVAWQTIGSDHYLAFGAQDGTVTILKYTYSELTNVASFAHGTAVNAIGWNLIGSAYYLAIAGEDAPDTKDARVLAFDGSTLTQVGSFEYGYQKTLNTLQWFSPGSNQQVILVAGEQNEAGDGLCVLEFMPTTSELVLFSQNLCYDFQNSCSISPVVNSLNFLGLPSGQLLIANGGTQLQDAYQLASLLIPSATTPASSCQIINNSVNNTTGERATGIFADSAQNYIAQNYSCNTTPQQDFPPTIFNYSLVDSLFLGSQANALGVDNIDCQLPNTPIPPVIDFTGTYTTIAAISQETWSIESKCELISSNVSLIPAQLPVTLGQTTTTPLAGQTIDQPGSYFLRNDLVGAISITADDVTLDLNDFSITGNISISSCQNVTIKNGKIVASALDSCTMLDTTTDVYVQNIILIGGVDGIVATNNNTNLVVSNCQFLDYAENGIECQGINGLRVQDCYLHSTQGAVGILTTTSENIEITNTQFILENSGTYATGCWFDSISNIVVCDCTFQANNGTTSTGINCTSCDTVLIEKCTNTMLGNAGLLYGFLLGGCQNSTLRDCQVLDTGMTGTGFYTTSNSVNITCDRCVAQNCATGFSIDATNKITLEHCIAQANSTGFDFSSTSTRGLVQECIAQGNGTGFNDGAGAASTITYAANIARNNTTDYSTLAAPYYPVSLANSPTYWNNVYVQLILTL